MTATGIGGAVEVATAVAALRPGHPDLTPEQLRAVLIDHLNVESLASLAALAEVLVRAAAARVDALLANPEHLALCVVAAAGGTPVTAKDLAIDYEVLLRGVGQANARRG